MLDNSIYLSFETESSDLEQGIDNSRRVEEQMYVGKLEINCSAGLIFWSARALPLSSLALRPRFDLLELVKVGDKSERLQGNGSQCRLTGSFGSASANKHSTTAGFACLDYGDQASRLSHRS